MKYKKLWTPSENHAGNSNMKAFMDVVNQKQRKSFADYHKLFQWSVENPDEFWGEFWKFSNIKYSENFSKVVDNPGKMPGAKWFQGAKLNFAENLLQRRDDHPAIIFNGEFKVEKTISFKQLYDESHKVAEALKRIGVEKGDRVAAFMPNMPETVIAMLATASIGAIWSSTSPDFGIKGVLDRFSQIKPKVIFSADGYYYNGKQFDSQKKLKGILEQLETVEKVVLVDYTGTGDTNSINNSTTWDEFATPVEGEMTFEQLPFDHPLYIMYSSGTTGLPKSIVHSAGGTLIQHLKELMLHCDVKRDDVVFYFTTCGWMMWNWFVSSLALGATIVCFDGNPFYPGPEALLELADKERFTLFGTSARYIASLKDAGVKPKQISSFPRLKAITSTGSPLSDESFDYVYSEWKEDVQLSSIAGGTDIVSCFVLGNPLLPVYRGEIQCRGLGMDVDCFDHEGNSLIEQQGELVCKTAFPSMPVYFWNDPGDKKYRSAYFEDFPGIWRHGDYIFISPHGGVTMYGRSDATLNPGGVRIGTAEIYSVLENMDEIEDSVVVGQSYEGDERVILFVQLKSDVKLDDELIQQIRKNIRANCSPRHVPAVILPTPDVPYTLNGKKVEVAVKKLIHGKEVKNRDALRNPECLDYFKTALSG
jgi:acetoacetyl-CoA synthetase